MSEHAELELVHMLADGELSGAEADRAREHLATCAECQAELADIMQLHALAAPRVAGSGGDVISLAWYRRRRFQLVTLAVVAAAGVTLYLATAKHAHEEAPPAHAQIALAPRRQLEARVSWGPAAEFRDYDVPRAGEPAHESIPLAVLADVEKTGDVHGVGVLALLDGEHAQAASYLDRAGDSADVISDRAALALADGQPARALSLADAALAKQPHHAPALWNRGLALRALGLTRGAAAAFRAVADKHERGWADEAGKRAAALDAEADALEQRFQRLNQASVALASGKLEMSLDDARAEPGYARGILYDAIRSAPTRERLDARRPLAKVIDEADGDHAVQDAIDRAAASLHPELARQYGEMIRALSVEARLTQATGDEKPVPTGPARKQLLAQLRAAHADDLLIGVLMKLADDRSTLDDDEVPEFARLTAASPDPWMQMLGLEKQALVKLREDDLIGAEAILLRARERCSRGDAPVFRCVIANRLIGDLYLKWLRLPEARAALDDAWKLAMRSGEWFLLADLLRRFADLHAVESDAEGSSLPLVRAYTDEIVRRAPAAPGLADVRCQVALIARTEVATVLFNQHAFAQARRALEGPTCARIDSFGDAAIYLFLRAELAEQSGNAGEIAAVRADIAKLRASPQLPKAQQILLDHSEGRVVIGSDAAAGEALLRRAIAEAKQLPASVVEARRAAAWSYAVLAIAAAKRGDAQASLGVLAEEQQLAAPKTCVLGIALDGNRRAFVARDAAGKPLVHYDETRTTAAIDPASLVPAEIATPLGACASVDVIARPPVHGMARILPDAIAWRYLARRASAPGPASDKRLVIANVEPPPALELPHLQTWSSRGEVLSGAQATPSRVLAAIGTAGDVIVHAHGIVDAAQPDASYLALSPDADGRFALTVGDVHQAHFTSGPVIILAACRASQAAPVFHEPWSLPAAFVYAGARAVIASASPIPDADAEAFFDAVRTRIHAGAGVAIALRDARLEWIAQHRGAWVRDVIVFE
ncbi:MAG: CHAT domain-containing protein [Acidobacteriota bacterium]